MKKITIQAEVPASAVKWRVHDARNLYADAWAEPDAMGTYSIFGVKEAGARVELIYGSPAPYLVGVQFDSESLHDGH